MKNFLLTTALSLVTITASMTTASAEAVTDVATQKAHHATTHEAPHWGYTGQGATPHWGNLDESYHACKTGQFQSPVNIARYLEDDLPLLSPQYTTGALEVLNNGHTVQVNFDLGSHLTLDGKTYHLLQAHFHTPSEHYLDGAPYPMEGQLVHKAEDGTLAMIAVMFKLGHANPAIEKIWQHVPSAGTTVKPEGFLISGAELLPQNLDYYKYEGSLTTPPCSEGVQWHVLKDPLTISEKQLRAFQSVFPVNARPVQPLNERTIHGN